VGDLAEGVERGEARVAEADAVDEHEAIAALTNDGHVPTEPDRQRTRHRDGAGHEVDPGEHLADVAVWKRRRMGARDEGHQAVRIAPARLLSIVKVPGRLASSKEGANADRSAHRLAATSANTPRIQRWPGSSSLRSCQSSSSSNEIGSRGRSKIRRSN